MANHASSLQDWFDVGKISRDDCSERYERNRGKQHCRNPRAQHPELLSRISFFLSLGFAHKSIGSGQESGDRYESAAVIVAEISRRAAFGQERTFCTIYSSAPLNVDL
jgi:hypothetical protein